MMKQTCKDIRKPLEAKLAELEAEFGVSFRVGSMKYDDLGFKCSLTATPLGAGGEKVSPELQHLREFFPQIEGREVKAAGRDFIVTGWNTKARKRPVICTELGTGKTYSFTREGAGLTDIDLRDAYRLGVRARHLVEGHLDA